MGAVMGADVITLGADNAPVGYAPKGVAPVGYVPAVITLGAAIDVTGAESTVAGRDS